MKRIVLATIAALSLAAFSVPVRADEIDTIALNTKLTAIEAKQDEILKTLEELKAELAIVKVRATQRG